MIPVDKKIADNARDQCRSHGFAYIENVFPPNFIDEMNGQYEKLIDDGKVDFGSPLVEKRYAAIGWTGMSNLHSNLLDLIKYISEQNLALGTTSFSKYLGGAQLPKHVDVNPDFQWNIWMFVDHKSQDSLPNEWPICFELGNGEVFKAPSTKGALLIYNGGVLKHFRPGHLPENETSSSLVLGYKLVS